MFKQITLSRKALFFFPLFISALIATFSSGTNRKKQDLLNVTVCDTANAKYSNAISVIVTNSCNTQAGCHGSASPGSVVLESYQSVKDRTGDILSRIQSGNMPKNNAKLDDCSIAKFESWVNKGALNN